MQDEAGRVDVFNRFAFGGARLNRFCLATCKTDMGMPPATQKIRMVILRSVPACCGAAGRRIVT